MICSLYSYINNNLSNINLDKKNYQCVHPNDGTSYVTNSFDIHFVKKKYPGCLIGIIA